MLNAFGGRTFICHLVVRATDTCPAPLGFALSLCLEFFILVFALSLAVVNYDDNKVEVSQEIQERGSGLSPWFPAL